MSSLESAPVFITGMSGAGLSSAGRVLEDMGWYVVHNLPPEIILNFIALASSEDSPAKRIAIVSDVRSREFHGSIGQVMESLIVQGINPTMLFMEARDDVLIKRFDTVRRTHPLQGSGTLQTGIDREREMLSTLKESADLILDTSEMSIHDLRRAIEDSFKSIAQAREHVTIQSFGFKHGSPRDADVVVDMRFLPNPFWVPELRPFRGTDKPVSDYVLSQSGAQEFLDNFVPMFTTMVQGYQQEGKRFISLAVGCTGGHHRSVAIAEELGRRLAEVDGLDVSVTHRDISRG